MMRHWTQALASEHFCTEFGARFHLRKLFLRTEVEEFSSFELEFITQYLVNETTLPEQTWWKALTSYEQLEIVSRLELHHVARDDSHTLWFSSTETTKECILIYGSAEAKPNDLTLAPVLKFTQGSVVGNMTLPPTLLAMKQQSSVSLPVVSEQKGSSTSSLPGGSATNVSSATWRRVKREQAFRTGIEHYSKLVIEGPADYFTLTSADIMETTAKAIGRMQCDELMRTFGLQRFLGHFRRKTFEAGSILAKEDEYTNTIYFILEGECRASVRVEDLVEKLDESKRSQTIAAEVLLYGHNARMPCATDLSIASLGPRSIVGDISMLLGMKEPTTTTAMTTVTVLALSHDDYLAACGDLNDPINAAPIDST